MSAFIVPASHIEALVQVAIEGPVGAGGDWSFYWHDETKPGGYVQVRAEHGDEIGRMLLTENILSVRYRYDDDPTDELPGFEKATYSFAYRGRRLTAIEAIKAIHCYRYQACEHPEWETSRARAFLAELADSLESRIPGYDEADGWAIDDYDETGIPGGMAGATYRRAM